MTQEYKVLGQALPAQNTDVALYTVPLAKQAVCSTLNVCNLAGAATTFRIAVRPGGAALADVHANARDVALEANDAIPITVGLTLGAGDIVSVRSGSGNVSFSLFGSEITP